WDDPPPTRSGFSTASANMARSMLRRWTKQASNTRRSLTVRMSQTGSKFPGAGKISVGRTIPRSRHLKGHVQPPLQDISAPLCQSRAGKRCERLVDLLHRLFDVRVRIRLPSRAPGRGELRL